MNYYVLLKMVPDTVEELEIAPEGTALDQEVVRLKVSDSDEHALEAALLLKEKHGGSLTVMALEAPEVEEVLFTALAKGATRAVKIAGEWGNAQSLAAAQVMAGVLAPDGKLPPDAVVMLRSQAIDDLEGEVGPYLAELLQAPYLGIVTGIAPENGGLTLLKEFAGGLRGQFSMPLPAVIGIQSAEKPPRYVPIAKVRAVQKTAKIEVVDGSVPARLAAYPVEKMYKPEVAGRAQMWAGSPEEIADQLLEVLAKNSLI